jgi:hypothetical protein|tara:strand:- start:317 stop:1087 length:771 start_codon:yes stop_codon:yes gene_type:complete
MEEQTSYIDEAKELDGTADTVTPESDVSEQQAEETPVVETQNYKVGEQEFNSIDELVEYASNTDKSYKNLQELNGRQTNELGELRKSIDEVRLNTTPQEVEQELPEYDPYDLKTILPHISKQIEDKFASERKVQDREITEKKMKDAQQGMIDSFIKTHPDMSNEDLTAIAKYGDERGVALINDAYTLMTLEQEKSKAKTEGVKQVTDKLTQADEVPTTLSNATGGNKTAIDFDAISQDDWNKLPPDVRLKALQDSP